MAQALTLPIFVELLIMWLIPNIIFGWKIGGGRKAQTYCKFGGKYVSPIVAYVGSIFWVLLVNYWAYPVISASVESFFASVAPSNYPLYFLAIFAIGFIVFKKEKWS